MPFYDVSQSSTTNSSANTVSYHAWFKTAAEQETVGIIETYATARGATAGGAQMRLMANSGTTASGGGSLTPQGRNLRISASLAAQSTWKSDGSTITQGTSLTQRLSFGFACTGGQGGWMAPNPQAMFQAQPNAANPVDFEWESDCANASVPFDLTTGFCEGMG